ncbi:putative Secreted peptidase [Streptomyces sp. F-3]|uniref:LysM peptidoglycan-binding domain-containing M23 family metallopeptidase n=1 Tax=Streptomyces TaxID=1883 RepID=UPI0007C28EE7|nr:MULTISPECIES: M23 family metallopeptidase [Streptomyces]MDN5383911.1 LysM peptidoglycan-binding domain-containing M23 family metallopeptidase [Streptomyces sp. LB8]GAT81819.1 putative Secreted peptidase [Streptomyces sp. F-3]
MPAKGKHRRPKTRRLTRSLLAAGTGGAAFALPLVSAAGAHAAPAHSPADKAVQAAPTATPVTERSTAAEDREVRTYTVRVGDCLSTIADEHNIRGGWQKLYADNRRAVGDNPSLIHPGLRLVLDGRAASAGTTTTPTSPASGSSSPFASSKPSAAPSYRLTSKPSGQSSAPSSAPKTKQAPRAPQKVSTGFTFPVAGKGVSTGYRVAGGSWSSGYHTGVDFAVPTGTPVRAVGAGTVVSAGWGGAYGNQVVIRLNDGHYAQYAHLSSISVSVGQSVSTGQRIGLSGATGNVTGPHLHFEIRTTPNYGSDIDPVAYLRARGATLG